MTADITIQNYKKVQKIVCAYLKIVKHFNTPNKFSICATSNEKQLDAIQFYHISK